MTVGKILLVCGNLEPGQDGVGDYTRELAGALQSKNITIKIVALMDRGVSEVVEENQPTQHQDVKAVRMGSSLSFTRRRAAFQMLASEFKPDWISLQYVPYAFSAKGIPLKLSRFLKMKNASFKWHFMMHESFIAHNLSLKEKGIQWLQIFVIKNLIKKLKVSVIHTSNLSYQSRLKSIGIQTELLGLFGNIPLITNPPPSDTTDVFRGVYFGAVPKNKNCEIFVKAIQNVSETSNSKIEIILCGKSGEAGKSFADALRKNANPKRLKITEKGKMSARDLSELFLKVDFGIARVPPNLLGKSGSVIAMLEHGLRLWVPLAEDGIQIATHFDFRTDQCFANLIDLRKEKHKFAPESRLEEIVTKYVLSLNRSQNTNAVL